MLVSSRRLGDIITLLRQADGNLLRSRGAYLLWQLATAYFAAGMTMVMVTN